MKQKTLRPIKVITTILFVLNVFSVSAFAKNFNADVLSKSARKSLRGPSGGSNFGGGDEGGFCMGLGLNYNAINLGKSTNSIGVSGIAEYAASKFGYRLGYFYGLPTTDTYPTIGMPTNGTFDMFLTNYKSTINMTSLFFDTKLFFNGNGDGFYLFGGIGYNTVLMKQELETNKAGFNFNIIPKTNVNQIFIRCGLGADISIGFGKFFVEGLISLPANQVNGVNVLVKMPGYFGATTGIKFNF